MDAEQIELPDGRIELSPERRPRRRAPLQRGPRADADVEAHVDDVHVRRALDLDGRTAFRRTCSPRASFKNGMSWKQAIATILIGNVIVLAPILANSHPGTKYGIPFPVFARSAYGVFGANVPAVMRAIVGCGWFGINAWIGGQALQTFFRSLWPGWATLLGGKADNWLMHGHYATEWVTFLMFWSLNILIVYRGMDLVRKGREPRRAVRPRHDRSPRVVGGRQGPRAWRDHEGRRQVQDARPSSGRSSCRA